MKNIKMKKYFIAYFDILGFANFDTKHNVKQRNKLYNALRKIIGYSKIRIEETKRKYQFISIEYKVFSDNFIFYTDIGFIDLLNIIGHIQADLTMHNIFLRGSIVSYYSK